MSPKDQLFNHKHNPMIRSDYRPAEYKIDKADLYINLDADLTEVRSRISVQRNPVVADLGGPLILDGEDLDLITLKILENGKWRDLDRQEFTVTDKNLTLKRPPAGPFELEIVTEISPKENTKLEGIYASGDIIGSQNESQGFRHITYYLDRPDNLAKFTVTLEGDKQKHPVMISNGNGDYKVTKDLGNGRHAITWTDPWPKPSYLFATIAGDMRVVEDSFTTMSGKNVKLAIVVPPGYEDKVSWAMECIKRSMKWDEEKYGREYDLDSLHLIGLEKFNMGAMENKGAIVFNIKDLCGSPETSTDEELLRIETVVGHEYFHNWTGDRVTVRDWFEISLKESLTELRNEQFSADMNSRAIETINNATLLRAVQFREDASPSAHCVRPERVEDFQNIYSSTVYQKGARVLAMMNTILGDDMWRTAMDEYFRKFDGQAVTVDDFIDNMQEVSGVDLTQFRRWYTQSGTPEISYEGKYDAAAKTYSLTLKQHTPATAEQPLSEKKPLHIPVSVGLIGESGRDINMVMAGDGPDKIGRTTRVLNLTQAEQTFVFHNVSGPVVPSILRGFSAPVKIMTQPSDQELIFRMAHDSDPFNKYEAVERLMLKTIEGLLKDQKEGKPLALPQDFLNAYGANLAQAAEGDQAFAAKSLMLPVNGIIFQSLKSVDPLAVLEVTDFMKQALAKTFKDEFMQLYKETAQPAGEVYDVVPEQAGRRALRNKMLAQLSGELTPEVSALAEQQYIQAGNMSEKAGALTILSKIPGKKGEQALEAFYQAYKHDTNVVDTWLTLQASIPGGDVLGRVKGLMEHEAFDITNPNKVRAVIRAFTNNLGAFHKMDGSGYKLLADLVIKLNDINPHTAGGIISGLTQFTIYDLPRQKVMVQQLERIMQTPKLNSQVKDLVGKALESAPKAKAAPAPKLGL